MYAFIDIYIKYLMLLQNWLAFESLHRPLFSEHNDVSFQNNALPPEKHNFAFCQVSILKCCFTKRGGYK